jgi:hypothetical protein
MKKLLLGSALAASVLLAGSSFAETKVNGYLETTLNTKSTTTTSTEDNSGASTIGHETSIGLTNTKELDNGISVLANIRFQDGTTEDQKLMFSMGNTTIAIGNDVTGVADNVSQEDFTPHASQDFHSVSTGGDITGVKTTHGENGIYLIQKSDLLTLEANYSPSSNTASTGASKNDAVSGSGSDIAVHGSLGVEGLKVGYGTSKRESENGIDGEAKGTAYGIKYAMAGFTVGYGAVENETAAKVVSDITTYGISYQVNDQITLSIAEGTVDKGGEAVDEEYQTIQVGYDFGGLGVTAGYYTIENDGYTNGTDNSVFEIRTVTKF